LFRKGASPELAAGKHLVVINQRNSRASFPGHAAEGEANTVSGGFSLRKSSQKQSSKSKVIGGNSYQFAEWITPNLGYTR